MVGVTGIEPVTPSMSTKCSPAELHAHCHSGRRHEPGIRRVKHAEGRSYIGDKPQRQAGNGGCDARRRAASGGSHQTVNLGHEIAQMEGL